MNVRMFRQRRSPTSEIGGLFGEETEPEGLVTSKDGSVPEDATEEVSSRIHIIQLTYRSVVNYVPKKSEAGLFTIPYT